MIHNTYALCMRAHRFLLNIFTDNILSRVIKVSRSLFYIITLPITNILDFFYLEICFISKLITISFQI